MKGYTRNIIVIAVFGAAAVGGGLLKIPSPYGSIALDSLPGYFVAAFFNPVLGGLVGVIGHLGSAATAGFPLGHLHVVIAIQMFLWCGVFGWIARGINRPFALYLGGVVAIGLNGVLSPFTLVPFGFPMIAAKGAILFLVIAAAVNVILAAVAVKILSKAKIRGI